MSQLIHSPVLKLSETAKQTQVLPGELDPKRDYFKITSLIDQIATELAIGHDKK